VWQALSKKSLNKQEKIMLNTFGGCTREKRTKQIKDHRSVPATRDRRGRSWSAPGRDYAYFAWEAETHTPSPVDVFVP
jgi:hypothetical protein